MPLVAASLLWFCMYAGQGGIINTAARPKSASRGRPGCRIRSGPSRDRFHGCVGAGNSMVIFLAGLQACPCRLEASIIDGANWLAAAAQRDDSDDSRRSSIFNVIMGIIGGFRFSLRL